MGLSLAEKLGITCHAAHLRSIDCTRAMAHGGCVSCGLTSVRNLNTLQAKLSRTFSRSCAGTMDARFWAAQMWSVSKRSRPSGFGAWQAAAHCCSPYRQVVRLRSTVQLEDLEDLGTAPIREALLMESLKGLASFKPSSLSLF